MTLAVLCPGQGSQHARMFETLRHEDRAQPILEKTASLTDLDLADLDAAEASGVLAQNRVAQVLVVGHSLALHSLLDLPPRGLVVLGYSVGDLTAHAVAGAISVDDALALADARGSVMDRAAQASPSPLGMAGIRGLSETQMAGVLPETVQIALVNGPDHVVIAGPVSDLDTAEQTLQAMGAHVRRLGVTVASHTSYMLSAAAEFRDVLSHYEWRRPSHRLLSPIDGSTVTTRDKAIDCLSRQIAERLDWAAAVEALFEYGVSATLELGAGRALSSMVAEANSAAMSRAVDDFKTFEGVSQWAARYI